MTEESTIRFEGVEKWLGHQHVLRGIDLEVKNGECLVIIGRSGCGKSVLLKNLIGIMKPNKGRILVDGNDIVPLKEKDLVPVRKKIGMVFQGGALFDSLTTGENIAFPLREEKKYSEKEIQERVEEVLDAVGLAGQQRKMSAELSGGMRKRVALARAIARRPATILYDEPTTGLDPVTSDSIDKLIVAMGKKYGVTSIVVTHDMRSVATVSHRVAMLHDGRVYALDTFEGLKNNQDPVVQHFILGISDDTDRVI